MSRPRAAIHRLEQMLQLEQRSTVYRYSRSRFDRCELRCWLRAELARVSAMALGGAQRLLGHRVAPHGESVYRVPSIWIDRGWSVILG